MNNERERQFIGTYHLPDQANTMVEHLGITFEQIEKGKVVAKMNVDERTCQIYGILNGGATIALAESVAGVGSIPLIQSDEMPCGAQVSANHISSAPVGTYVIATGTLLHGGRTTHVWNVDVTLPDGKMVSTVRVVNIIVKRRV